MTRYKKKVISHNGFLLLTLLYFENLTLDTIYSKSHKTLFSLQRVAKEELCQLQRKVVEAELKNLIRRHLVSESNGTFRAEPLGKTIGYTYAERENHSRHDFLTLIKPFFADTHDSRIILDIGSSGGVFLASLEKTDLKGKTYYIGIDVSLPSLQCGAYFLETPGFHQQFVCAFGDILPVASSSVDYVFSRGTILYLRPKLFFEEAFRVLKPGGKMMVITPMYAYHLFLLFNANLRRKIFATLCLLNGMQMIITKNPVFFSKLSSYSVFPKVLTTICLQSLFKNVRLRYFKNPNQKTKHLVLTAEK